MSTKNLLLAGGQEATVSHDFVDFQMYVVLI